MADEVRNDDEDPVENAVSGEVFDDDREDEEDVVDEDELGDEVVSDDEDEADEVEQADEEEADVEDDAPPAKPARPEEDDDEDDEDSDDVEEDLAAILKDRIAADDEDDDDEDEEEGARAVDRQDSAGRVPPRSAEEFSCDECFLLVRRSQFSVRRTDCPGGLDGADCPVKRQLGLA